MERMREAQKEKKMNMKTGRKNFGSVLTTLWLGLALLVGLLAQTRQVEAQANSAPPAEYQEWRWPKLPTWGTKPLSKAKIIAACIKANPKGGLGLAKCLAEKLGQDWVNTNCHWLVKTYFSPELFPNGVDPCTVASPTRTDCIHCAGVEYWCCVLRTKGNSIANIKCVQAKEDTIEDECLDPNKYEQND